MQKSFTSQAELFVSATDLDHPILDSLDDTEVPIRLGADRTAIIADL